jgi:hypothetical protein
MLGEGLLRSASAPWPLAPMQQRATTGQRWPRRPVAVALLRDSRQVVRIASALWTYAAKSNRLWSSCRVQRSRFRHSGRRSNASPKESIAEAMPCVTQTRPEHMHQHITLPPRINGIPVRTSRMERHLNGSIASWVKEIRQLTHAKLMNRGEQAISVSLRILRSTGTSPEWYEIKRLGGFCGRGSVHSPGHCSWLRSGQAGSCRVIYDLFRRRRY